MLLWQPLKNEGEDTKKNKLIHCFYVEIVKCFVYHSKIPCAMPDFQLLNFEQTTT